MAQWMQGRCIGEIDDQGRITIKISDYAPQDSARPKRIEESGADPEMVARIKHRTSGPINTLGFLGGAVAWTVHFNRLALLEPRLMAKLDQKYGPVGHIAYIAMVRNTAGNAIWNCAEPAGGMAESELLDLEQLGEGTELGICKDDGWVRFLLPAELTRYQDQFDAEQAHWWNVLHPGFPCEYEAHIEFLDAGDDTRDGVKGIWAAGPVGDISFTRVAHIHLEGGGWQLFDTESRPGKSEQGEPDWVALRRKVVAICPRQDKAPLMFEIGPDGKLHSGGLHIVIEGENRQHVISHLSEAVLTALGFL